MEDYELTLFDRIEVIKTTNNKYDLEHQLQVMEQLLPIERKQCEVIWKPVYDEYRKIGYRLKGK